MRGRKKKPTQLHLVEGTYHADRHGNDDEPKPELTDDVPKPLRRL